MIRLTGIVAIIVLAMTQAGFAGEGGTVFKEDFSQYDIGDPISDWGTTDIIVLKGSSDKIWIECQTPGLHKAEKRLILPENYVFTFQFIHDGENFDVIFIDNNESTHILSFYDYNRHVKFQDTVAYKTDLKWRVVHSIKIVHKNKTFRLFINDEFFLSSTPGGFGLTRGIAFKIQPSTRIGNIEIRELMTD